MKKNTSFVAMFLLLFCAAFGFAQESKTGKMEKELADIRAAIKQKGARWVAGETSLSRLPLNELKMLMGTILEPARAPFIDAAKLPASPAKLDWRDNGGNYVTSVKNQGKCGSCWAFAMTGALESYHLLITSAPGADLDLSEQIFLSCSWTGSCSGGSLWAYFLQDTGLPPETYYPYTATDGDCSNAAPDWKKAALKIVSWNSVSQNLSSIKSALAAYGPLPTAMMVYEDFKNYKSGVYSYTTGKKLGGHAILLVGYNDEEKYFILKNSWGPDWGENGYFKIAYSEISSVVDFGISTIVYKPENPRGL